MFGSKLRSPRAYGSTVSCTLINGRAVGDSVRSHMREHETSVRNARYTADKCCIARRRVWPAVAEACRTSAPASAASCRNVLMYVRAQADGWQVGRCSSELADPTHGDHTHSCSVIVAACVTVCAIMTGYHACSRQDAHTLREHGTPPLAPY